MSGCNQCLKVPCTCMDDPAELLRSEFPGWSVQKSADGSQRPGPAGYWMWRGKTMPENLDECAVVWEDGRHRLAHGNGIFGIYRAPDLLTAAENATGETRLSRRPKPETGTARIAKPTRAETKRAEALRAKGAAKVKERDFHKLSAIIEAHVADLRAAFPDRTWSFAVGMDLAASCIHENEFGDVPSYIQWRDGWFAGTEDGPETKTCATPVEAFRAFTADEPKRKNFATKPRHSLIPPHVLARHVLPVLHDGAAKHGRDHWRRCSTREYADAAMTHIQAFLDGDVMDESGRHALAHAAADLLLALGVVEEEGA